MNVLDDKQIERYRSEFAHMTDLKLLHQLWHVHSLLDSDDMQESLMIDEALDLEYLILWECANRFSVDVEKQRQKNGIFISRR